MDRFYTDTSIMAKPKKFDDGSSLVLILISLLITCLCQSTFATSSPKFNFDTKSEASFAKLMCGESEYFRECFNASKSECEKIMKSEARACDASYSTKQRAALKTEVQLFAEIGACTGIAVEKKWRDRKATTTKCDQKENWQ